MTKTINKMKAFVDTILLVLTIEGIPRALVKLLLIFLTDFRNYTKSEEEKISLGNSKSLYPYCSNALKKFQKSIWRRLFSI